MGRVLRALARLLGFLLILVGLVAAIAPIVYVVAVIVELSSAKSRFPALEPSIVVTTLVMVASLTAGLWLVRGKRRLVLFLRKFGFTGATQAVTFAVVNALGRSWRLVTLDDAEVAPVGARSGMRWFSIVVGLVAVGVVAYTLFWLFGGGFQGLLGDVVEKGMQGATLKDLLPKLFGTFVMAIVVGVVVLGLFLVPAGFASAVAIFAWTSLARSSAPNARRPSPSRPRRSSSKRRRRLRGGAAASSGRGSW